jgi:hypothetical protein
MARKVWMYSETDGDAGLYNIRLFTSKKLAEKYQAAVKSAYGEIDKITVHGKELVDELVPLTRPHIHEDSIWITRIGMRVPVKQMEDSHLLNTIRVLKSESPIGTRFNCSDEDRQLWIEVMMAEAARRGLFLDGENECREDSNREFPVRNGDR